MKTFAVGLSVAVVVCAASATACDLCAVYTAIEAEESKPGFYAGVFEQFTHFGTLQEDGDSIGNSAGQFVDSSQTQLLLGYKINGRVGLQLNVPYIHRSFRRAEGSSIERGAESGLGDLSLLANVSLWERMKMSTTYSWHLLLGLKLPSGDSARLKEELSETPPPPGAPASGVHGHDLALGSGSVDGIVGTTFIVRWKRLFASALVQYAIRSEGDFDYRYANDLTWSVGPGVYVWLQEEPEQTCSVRLNVSGEMKGKDSLHGKQADDTGLTAVYLGPELAYTWKDKLSVSLGVDIPVHQHNTALQLVPDYRVRAAFAWRF